MAKKISLEFVKNKTLSLLGYAASLESYAFSRTCIFTMFAAGFISIAIGSAISVPVVSAFGLRMLAAPVLTAGCASIVRRTASFMAQKMG